MEKSSSIERINQKELADDIWFEIFLLLPLSSIYRFRSVSKVWSSILSNPNFINKWYELNNSSIPWGFVRDVKVLDDWGWQFLYPELHSRFISDHQIGFSFRFITKDLDIPNFYLLGTSNGLVLCTTNFFFPKIYYVCNPLTQKWVLLPPPPPRENGLVYTGFVCNECFSEFTSYKVIRIPLFKEATKDFQAVIFSSDLGEWNVYHVSCPSEVTRNVTLHDNLLTHNGVFYWFEKISRNILAVNVEENTNHGNTRANECRLINLPDQAMYDENKYPSQCLGESEGLLCFARFNAKEKSLSIWVLDQDWYILHHDIKLRDCLAEMESRLIHVLGRVDLSEAIEVQGFSPVDKNVVVLSYKEYVWSYNIETRTYEQLCHSSFLGSNRPSVPHLCTRKYVLRPWPTILPPVSNGAMNPFISLLKCVLDTLHSFVSSRHQYLHWIARRIQ